MVAETLTQPQLLEKYPAGSVVPVEGLDQPTWIVRPEVLAELARDLRDNRETQFDLLVDLCGVDYPDRAERFEAVYHLYSIPRHERLRLKVPLREASPVLPSLIPVWKAANWFEREAYEMFGFRFEGHPALRHLYLPGEFEGHPLRKDFPLLARE
nr:NADH-quinone oxidoreductase subunit C [Thermoanaerobaculia bacterium]